MTSIAIIGDIHGNHPRLATSLSLLSGSAFDLALLTGDVGLDPPWKSAEGQRAEHDASVRKVLVSVQDALGCPVVFVPGNHDLPDPAPVSGARNVDGNVMRVSELTVAGLGGAGPTHFGFPYEWTEQQAESALEATFEGAATPPDLFLSHTPPAGTTLDRTNHGEHVGSQAVRRRIETRRPGLFVCGHIHESWGFARVAGVPCINAGALATPAEQDIAWRVLWDGEPTRVEVRRREPGGNVLRQSWDLRA